MSLPWGRIRAATTAELPGDRVLVTYCWSSACNGSTRAELRLSELGFAVKEMIGGIAAWRAEGFPVESADVRLG